MENLHNDINFHKFNINTIPASLMNFIQAQWKPCEAEYEIRFFALLNLIQENPYVSSWEKAQHLILTSEYEKES